MKQVVQISCPLRNQNSTNLGFQPVGFRPYAISPPNASHWAEIGIEILKRTDNYKSPLKIINSTTSFPGADNVRVVKDILIVDEE